MTSSTFDFPVPHPVDQVWYMLPYAVQRTSKALPGAPTYGGGYRFTFSTRLSLLTWGQRVHVDLYQQHPHGTLLRVTTQTNLWQLIDWGEGRSIATELHGHLRHLLSTW